MIGIDKLPKPTVLADHQEEWTRLLLELLQGAPGIPANIKTKYRHNDVKEQLREETRQKCAYCESWFAHVSPGDIEHILPKSRFPELTFEWANLTLACSECNRRKGDYHSASRPLLNPYREDPTLALEAYGPLIQARPRHLPAATTCQRLELNRTPLLERRAERILQLAKLRELIESAETDEEKELWEEELRGMAEPEQEYAFVVAEYLRLVGVLPDEADGDGEADEVDVA